MIKARFLPAAEAEFLREVVFYSEARDGLGNRFQASVAQAVERARMNPAGGTPGPKNTRSRLVKGFPFSVAYRASDQEILIIAVAHHRRKPGYWAKRV